MTLVSRICNYRPRSEGDNVIGSVRPSVCLSVCLSELSCLNRLTFDLDYRSEGLSVISRAFADNHADAVDQLLISIISLVAFFH